MKWNVVCTPCPGLIQSAYDRPHNLNANKPAAFSLSYMDRTLQIEILAKSKPNKSKCPQSTLIVYPSIVSCNVAVPPAETPAETSTNQHHVTHRLCDRLNREPSIFLFTRVEFTIR